MLAKEEKRLFIAYLFKHQDGVCIAPIIHVLGQKRVLYALKKNKGLLFSELAGRFSDFHKGYLNVALRSLASQGILQYSIDSKTSEIKIGISEKFEWLYKVKGLYSNFYPLYKNHLKRLSSPFERGTVDEQLVLFSEKLKQLKEEYKGNEYVGNEVLVHLEGVLIAPLLVYLNYYEQSVEALLRSDENLNRILENTGLSNNRELTPKGRFLNEKSYAYGVTVSYFPIFKNMDKFLYGNFMPFFKKNRNNNEMHVFRSINVWGSGGSHATYFKKFDTVIMDLFNKPIEEQPKGIIDVGCGNGAFIRHVFNLIWNSTSRRKYLKDEPLFLVGSDYNREALLSTKANLQKADIWAEVIWGDIGNPSAIDRKLREKYNVELSELLNIRSFLDHNRLYNPPLIKSNEPSISTGAFCRRGKLLDNKDVEQSLVEHFEKWQPFIQKHGLLLIELHTVAPEIVSLNLGKTPCTAYDVTHGFSDQYIVEVEVFQKAVQKAGLRLHEDYNFVFPNTGISTISINLIQ